MTVLECDNELFLGYIPLPFNAAYGATKAALTHFFAAERLEMAWRKEKPFSISLCMLGFIATDRDSTFEEK